MTASQVVPAQEQPLVELPLGDLPEVADFKKMWNGRIAAAHATVIKIFF